MFFNWNLFMQTLWLGTLCGIISTICIQKIKDTKLIKPSQNIAIISIITHFIIGIGISVLFTDLSWYMAIEVGIITWIGAESIYKHLKKYNLRKESNIKEKEKSSEEL